MNVYGLNYPRLANLEQATLAIPALGQSAFLLEVAT